jgi:hypothetical protein
MALLYTYPDAYLAKFCVEAREARAIEEVALLAGDRTLSADWEEKLVILQTYILSCLEHQGDTEDLFTAKLKTYREEMGIQLPRALAAADETANADVASVYSIPVSRA